MGELQGRGIVINSKASINYSRVYVVSIVAYQDYQDRCRPHKRRNWIFTHVGLSAHAHNIIIVQDVGWLLSGIEELTILCCSFLTLVANK